VEDVADGALITSAMSLLRTLQRLPGARDPLGMVLQGSASPIPAKDRPALLQAHDLACGRHGAELPTASLLAAAWLGNSRMRAIFAPIWTGLQVLRRARLPALGEVTVWCRALSEGAHAGLQELARLQQAEAQGRHLVRQRDRRSRLADVLAELVRQPVVTSVSIARQLQLTQQASSRLLQELEEAGLAIEVTGRATWRVYAVAPAKAGLRP
jgi:DNA-binding transcriptional ArsR family regulator